VQVSRDGLYLLTSSRHASVRLWDMRVGAGASADDRPLARFRGHQNTSSSFLRAAFAAEESLIVGGSDCGALHVWDRKNSDLLQVRCCCAVWP
jgi:COMPASS component SWD3